MGKLVAVVGNSGVGKTTLTQQLCAAVPQLTAAFEQHTERPFQALFATDLYRYGLANQIDYLLYRAEQEQQLRTETAVGIVDGGLDIDFHGFAKLFYQKGYLTTAEFELCQREYILLRQLLRPPEIIIYLTAPLDIIKNRYQLRGRALEIAQQDDLHQLDQLLQAWVATIHDSVVLTVDAAADDYTSPEKLAPLVAQIQRLWP